MKHAIPQQVELGSPEHLPFGSETDLTLLEPATAPGKIIILRSDDGSLQAPLH